MDMEKIRNSKFCFLLFYKSASDVTIFIIGFTKNFNKNIFFSLNCSAYLFNL